jgi:hypothetical protein
MLRDQETKGRQWLEQVALATGWKDAVGSYGFGGLRLTFWREDAHEEDGPLAQILACAPLVALSRFLNDRESAESLARLCQAQSAQAIDCELCLKHESVWVDQGGMPRAPGDLNPVLKMHRMLRNSANYMASSHGELVSVDPLRPERVEVLMVGDIHFEKIEAARFQESAESAMDRLKSVLGSACMFHMAGPARYWIRQGGGDLDKRVASRWPRSMDDWVKMALADQAVHEAQQLNLCALAGESRGKFAL